MEPNPKPKTNYPDDSARFRHVFAKRLESVMHARGVSGFQLQKALGSENDRSVYDYVNEKKTPNLYRFARMCRLLNVDANWLLGLNRVVK